MVRAWLAWFVALNLAWFLLIDSLVLAEEVLGLFASALAATVAVALGRQRIFQFRPRWEWLLPAWRLPGRTLRETGWVLGALARQLAGGPAARGSFRQIPVSLPDEESPSATKRALLTAGLSFPPNSFVLEIDSDREQMLVHELINPERRER
jgi:multisubunit Na+/H+ antiporter MnhE subunit